MSGNDDKLIFCVFTYSQREALTRPCEELMQRLTRAHVLADNNLDFVRIDADGELWVIREEFDFASWARELSTQVPHVFDALTHWHRQHHQPFQGEDAQVRASLMSWFHLAFYRHPSAFKTWVEQTRIQPISNYFDFNGEIRRLETLKNRAPVTVDPFKVHAVLCELSAKGKVLQGVSHTELVAVAKDWRNHLRRKAVREGKETLTFGQTRRINL